MSHLDITEEEAQQSVSYMQKITITKFSFTTIYFTLQTREQIKKHIHFIRNIG